MPETGGQFLQGTLEILILKALSWGPMHGYGVGNWLEQRTGSVLTIEEGSLYPALHRMERKGWIEAEWRLTEKKRRAKYYDLTKSGRERLRAEAGAWARFADAVSEVLEGREAPTWARST